MDTSAQYYLFVALAPPIALISVLVGAYVWRFHAAPAAKALLLQIATVTSWLVLNTLELVDPTEVGTVLWAKLIYIFVSLGPVLWLAFALQFTSRQRLLTPALVALLCVIPLVTTSLALTNELHGLIWQSYSFEPIGGMLAMRVTHGPWFGVHIAYSYLLIIIGAFLVGHQYFRSFRLYRQQSAWILVGAIGPLLVNAIYVSRLIPGFTKDFSSIAFAFSSVAFAFGMFRYRLFDLKPVARNILVDRLSDGMLALDESDRIVDMNRTARAILGADKADVIGQRAVAQFGQLHSLIRRLRNSPDTQTDITITQNGVARHYELQISPLQEQRGRLTGWLVVMHDITARKQAETEREKLIAELQVALNKVKTLSGLLPICANCKKIRDDKGYWHQVEAYLQEHSDVDFSHGICPDCARLLYPDLLLDEEQDDGTPG